MIPWSSLPSGKPWTQPVGFSLYFMIKTKRNGRHVLGDFRGYRSTIRSLCLPMDWYLRTSRHVLILPKQPCDIPRSSKKELIQGCPQIAGDTCRGLYRGSTLTPSWLFICALQTKKIALSPSSLWDWSFVYLYIDTPSFTYLRHPCLRRKDKLFDVGCRAIREWMPNLRLGCGATRWPVFWMTIFSVRSREA